MVEIARLAGVHQTTVSRALRNDTRIPAATRERVQAIARKVGYRPNPLVSALVAIRRARHPSRYQATLAFIIDRVLGDAGTDHLAGVRAAADQLGFKLDLFVLGQGNLTAERLDHVLLARGINGVIVGSLPVAHGGFALSWERYSAIVIEYTFVSSAFDRIVHDSYAGMRLIMQECRRRQVRRVGLALTTIGHERTEQLNGAAFWIEQKTDHFFAAIPPLVQTAWDAARFDAWFDRHRPEAIVTSNALLKDVISWCAARKVTLGRELQLVNVNANPSDPISGVVQNHFVIGSTATWMVVDKINRGDRGIPAVRHTTLTPGTWLEGTTLRPPV